MPPSPQRPDVLAWQVFRGSDAVRDGLLTRHQLRSRAWLRLSHDVYADARLPRDHGLACRAAALLLPPGAVIAGPSAAYLHGVEHAATFETDVHVLTRQSARMTARKGVRVHTTNLPVPLPAPGPAGETGATVPVGGPPTGTVGRAAAGPVAGSGTVRTLVPAALPRASRPVGSTTATMSAGVPHPSAPVATAGALALADPADRTGTGAGNSTRGVAGTAGRGGAMSTHGTMGRADVLRRSDMTARADATARADVLGAAAGGVDRHDVPDVREVARAWGEVPKSEPAWAAWETAAWLDPVRAVGIVDTMLGLGVTTRTELVDLAARHLDRPGGRQVLQVFELADPGAQSPPESYLRARLVLAGLPRPVTQHPVPLPSGLVLHPDLAWPDFQVAVEYDGQWHADPEQLHRDRLRLNQLAGAGWLVLRVTGRRLRHDFPAVLREVCAALSTRGWRR